MATATKVQKKPVSKSATKAVPERKTSKKILTEAPKVTQAKEAAEKEAPKKVKVQLKLEKVQPAPAVSLIQIPVSELSIKAGFNVRESYGDIDALANSILVHGIKLPLKVARSTEDDTKFIVVDGHRRFLAVEKLLKSKKIKDGTFTFPAIEESPEEANSFSRLLSLLIYNGGKSLTILEEAEVYRRLQDAGMEAKEAARLSSKSVTHVYDCNLLMSAPDSLLGKIRRGEVAATLVIEQLKQNSGDGEQVEGAIEKAQEKAGKKKVSRKNLKSTEQNEDNQTFKIGDLKKVIEGVEGVDYGPYKVRGSRIRVLKGLLALLLEEVEFPEFAKLFGDQNGVRPEDDLNEGEE